MRFIAILSLCLLVPFKAEAKPTRHAVDEFKDDRWEMVAQAGTSAVDVNRTMRCPAPLVSDCRKRRRIKHRWKRQPVPGVVSPVVRLRPQQLTPVPRARPAGAPEPDEAEAATNAVWERIAVALRANDGPPRVPPLVRMNLFEGFWREIMRAASPPKGRSLAGIVKPLAAKVMQLASLCPGTTVISTVRPGAVVRGSGRPSLHRYGKAVDIGGNFRCLYVALRGFPGGVSTDAYHPRIRHIHISWDPGGREWHSRFAHYRGGMKRTRYARHHRYRHSRYARHDRYRHHHYASVR